MSPRPDPARRRPGDPSPPPLDYRQEAATRVEEAASCLRVHLDKDPQSIDALTNLELAIVRSVLGRRWIERVERRADQLDRIEREVERANRPTMHVRFPGMRDDRDPVPEDNKERGTVRRFTT
jgi:hypothetical protein